MNNKCPNCGRNLIGSSDGRIGQCKLHGWFPMVEGAEAEAAKRNADDESARRHARLQEEADKQRKIDEENKKRHRKIVSVILAAAAVIAVAAGLLLYFVIKPGNTYHHANQEYEAGRYVEAQKAYLGLGNYQDSVLRASLCDIMLMIQSGDTDHAITAINELVLDGKDSARTAFAKAVSPVLTDWNKKNLPPELVIAIIHKLGNAQLLNDLDSSGLWLDAHAALLPDQGLYYWQADVNDDGQNDLLVIRQDGSVSVYDMSTEGNRSITVKDDITAKAANVRAQAISQEDPVGALLCMSVAYKTDPDNSAILNREYAAELIDRWKAIGIEPARLLQTLGFADIHGMIEHTDLFSETWREAALAVSGTDKQHSFADWNQDGLDELLMLSDSNQLQLYGYHGEWTLLSELDDLPDDASYIITSDAPVIVVLSSAKDSMLSVTISGNQLHKLFRQDGISQYTANGTQITYSVALSGSILRTGSWVYDASASVNRPVRTGIDWQRDNYPLPTDANAAMSRYIEARVYAIDEESAILTAQSDAEGFSLQSLNQAAFPDSIEDVSFAPYSVSENEVLYEVSARITGRTTRAWYAVCYDGQWKIAGVSDSFAQNGNPDGGDIGIPLIATNAETTDRISQKGGRATYRLLLPKASRIVLQWQAGSGNSDSNAFTLFLYQGSVSSSPVINYNLKLSASKQQTNAMFLAPGVYYLTVDAKADATPEYHVTVLADAESNIELEKNDTSKQATPIQANQSYTGSLLTSDDVDFYIIRLDSNAAVNVSLKCSGNGDKKTVFIGAVYNGSTGEKLTTFDLPGNMPLTETSNLYLGSGVYLIQINKGSAWTDEEYTLTVTTQTEGVMEAESNNTPNSANTVPVNEVIHGSFSTKGDIDCYHFTLDADAAVQLQFSFASTGSSSKTYVLTVMDGNQRILQTVNIGGKETSKVIAPLALKAGTYTVKIENPQYSKQEYTLQIVSQSVALSESEPNNAASAATTINVGKPITGVLSSENDEDYYKITFTDQTTVTLSFTFTQGTSKSNAFNLSIERNGKTEWKQSISAASGGIEQAMTVPAGEYYIRIKPGTAWNGNLYTLSIK